MKSVPSDVLERLSSVGICNVQQATNLQVFGLQWSAGNGLDYTTLDQQPLEKKAGSQLYLSEKVAAQEKELIEAALRERQGRVFGPSGAAEKLGIARSTLESKIRRARNFSFPPVKTAAGKYPF